MLETRLKQKCLLFVTLPTIRVKIWLESGLKLKERAYLTAKITIISNDELLRFIVQYIFLI